MEDVTGVGVGISWEGLAYPWRELRRLQGQLAEVGVSPVLVTGCPCLSGRPNVPCCQVSTLTVGCS